MDPISAFGLAVNILTVVDLSAKVIVTASEIWSSGEPTSNHDRDLVAEHLRSCCKKITGSGQKFHGKRAGGLASSISPQHDVKLREIASEVADIADDIQRSLIRRSKHGTITKTLRDSILVIWGEKKMREKTERLHTLRGELQFGVIVSLKSKLDVVALRTNDQLEKLDEMTRELVRTLLSDNENWRLDLEEHLAAIHKSVGRYVDQMEDTARQRHGELLNAILASSAHPSSIMASDFQTLTTEKVLDKLWFSRIDDRYEDISRAHRKTFEWIFSEDVELQPDCNFLKWAENGDGIYWMSGRAGTGKSTLMKFLADDVRMQKLFRLWAGDQGLVMSKYWFWDQSKDDLQKSLDGMYRGIMYELIRKEPLFAPLLFPDQFKAGRDWIRDFPTSNELKRAFRRLVSAESPPVYVALLIDGLDEYRASEQAQLDLAQSLKIAAESKHLKIIASSRPETVFERTFKDSAKFYLHNLTCRDLELFITDKLQDHERMPYLAGIPGGEEARSQLISAAVERSEGIFLWLRLVVESLIQELDVCDQISDLRSVLDRFPRGLEALFLHMIRRMLGNSENRGLQCLWLMRRSLNVKSLQSPYITSKVGSVSTRRDTFQLTALCLEGAQMPLQTLIDLEPAKSGRFENIDTIYKMGNRLRSWCAGLLEMESGQGGGDPEISFIHRSVAEFLDLPSTRAELMDGMSEMAKEDTDFSLMKGLLALIKKKARGEIFDTNSEVWYWVELIIRLARFIGDSHEEMTIVLLLEMDRTMAVYSNEHGQTRNDWTSYYPWAVRKTKEGHGPRFFLKHLERSAGFLSIAVESGLEAPVLHMLDLPGNRRTMQASRGLPLLGSACMPPPFSIVIPGSIRPTVVARLLELGADPNQEYENIAGKRTTPWQDLLRTVSELQCRTVESARQLSRIIAMMVEHGANQHVEVELYLRRPRRRRSFGDDSAGINGLSGNADVVSMDEMARHILSAKDIISRAFIEVPKYRYVGSDEGLLGDFVPFEDVDSHWELDAETWGYTYGATYPPDAAPPPLAVADKEQIAQMGRVLLKTLGQKSATAKLGGTGREGNPQQQTASFARFRELKAKMHSRFRLKKS